MTDILKENSRRKKFRLYLIMQLAGWFGYVLLAGVIYFLQDEEFEIGMVSILLFTYLCGILISHGYRNVIVRLGWVKYNIVQLIPRILISSILASGIMLVLFSLFVSLFIDSKIGFSLSDKFPRWISFAMLFVSWSLIYFTYHFFQRYRIEEIKNLRWEATKNEIELNKLKSQLNPHFIFNSMNTIRALVDEDPKKAKRSITQLSNILRLTLMMGARKSVSFDEEMKIVSDYLSIEKARYEERLNYRSDISPGSERYQIPSMMIQTLVENGIKHGISKLPGGGEIFLETRIVEDKLHITIENSGQLNGINKSETGFGLVNTKQRLLLLYDQKAEFSIQNKDEKTVITKLVLPLEPN